MSEMIKNIKAIIFDMDGVILDSESISDITWRKAAEERGLSVNDQILNACRGSNKNDTIVTLKKYYGADFDSEKFLERTSELFHEIEDKEGIPLLPYAREILEYLKPRYRLALASSTRGPTVERQLRAVGLIDFFETRTTGEQVEHSKPNPEIYLMACKSIGMKPEECIAIEDSLNGIRSAHAAGLHPIMVIDKVQPTDEIRNMCEAVFDSLNEVKNFLYYEEYEADTIEKLLSRVKACDRENAKTLINHCLNDSIVHLDICDIDHCFSEGGEIEYLEFNSIKEAEPLLSKRGAIKALMLVMASGQNDELTMLEVQDCLLRIEAACGQKPEPDKLIWSQIQKAPVGYLHMLVQF